MAKYKSYNYSQTMMVPISLDDQLMAGTIEFAINMLVEERMGFSYHLVGRCKGIFNK